MSPLSGSQVIWIEAIGRDGRIYWGSQQLVGWRPRARSRNVGRACASMETGSHAVDDTVGLQVGTKRIVPHRVAHGIQRGAVKR